MATISISQLDTATQAKVDDLYEVAVVDANSQTGYASRKLTAAQIATLIAQGVQFSGLSTEAKTIIAAINEAAQNGGSEVEANPTGTPTDTLETIDINGTVYEVGGSEPVSKTATGNPIHIEDAADAPIVSGTVTFEPIQDLHGYDAPWVGGAGKNKLPMTVDGVKAVNTEGTWSGNVYTYNGGVYTVNTDDGENVTSIKANVQTSSNDSMIRLYVGDGTAFANNILNGNVDSAGDGIIVQNATESPYTIYASANTSSDVIINDCTGKTVSVYFKVGANSSVNNATIQPMIRLATETDPTFEPYSNICPITGYDDCELEVTGKNLLPYDIDTIKSRNTGGTWSANSYTYRGITFSFNDDGSFNVNGTATQSVTIDYASINIEANKTYTMNGSPQGGGPSSFRLYPQGKSGSDYYDDGNGVTFPVEMSDTTFNIRAIIYSGYTANNLLFKPMIRLATETDATYEPYQSNTYTIDLDGTRYGGKVDFVSGVMTVTHAEKDMGDLAWQYSPISGGRQRFEALVDGLKLAVNGDTAITAKSSIYKSTAYNVTWADGDMAYSYATNTNSVSVVNNAYSDAISFKAAMSGVKLVYELATPLIIQLTHEQIRTLQGTNNISTNMTSMTLEYITQEYQSLVKLIEQSAGHHYSTDEHVIGTWIDGKTLYEKVVDFGALPNTTSKSVAHNISNLDSVCFVDAIANNGSGAYIPVPFVSQSGIQYQLSLNLTTTDIMINTGDNFTNYSAFVTLQYTKTTD